MAAMAKPRIRVRADGTIPRGQAALLGFETGRRDAGRRDLSEFSGWNPGLGHAGSAFEREWKAITGRARGLDENNGWINAGLDRRVEAVVGVNIRLSSQPIYELLGRDYEWRMRWTGDVQARFKVWANDIERRCDARKRLSFGAMARLAYLTYARDGEAIAEIRDAKRGLRNTTNVLLIEPERVGTPPGKIEGPDLRNGIAFDRDGAATGAWVRRFHPSDDVATADRDEFDFIPAYGKTGRAKLVHIFNPRRIEQNRGVSRLAEVMVPAKMLDRVDRAEVEAALKSALLSIFIKSPGTTEDIEAALAPANDDIAGDPDPWISAYLGLREKNPVAIQGAQITHLLPGEDVETPPATRPNANYPDFARFVLQKVAGSLGVSYPQISQDWAGINYSSARALLNELWRSFLEDRHYFTQAFLTPIYAAWLEMEVALGDVKVPGGPANFYRNKTAICMAEWIGPGRGSVDPLKEANANNLDTAAGRTSTVETILERGRDPSDVLAEEDWYQTEREKRRGLGPVNHNVKAAAEASEQADADAAAEEAPSTDSRRTREPEAA